MVGNQFYYIRTEKLAETGEVREFTDSFSVDKIIRSVELEDGRRLILLNDIHERWEDKPVVNKMGKIASYKREKITVQSEIYLDSIDSERFIKLLNIE